MATPRPGAYALVVLLIALPLLLSKSLFSSSPAHGAAPVGLWHAELIPSVGHEVFFDLKVVAKGSGLSASLLNGASEIPFTSASWDGAKLTLELAHYDATVVAEPKGPELEGRYTRVIAAASSRVPRQETGGFMRERYSPASLPSGSSSASKR